MSQSERSKPVWILDTPDLYWIPDRARLARLVRAGMPENPNNVQEHFQLYDDDAAEGSSTSRIAKDTNGNVDVTSGDVLTQVRICVQQTNSIHDQSGTLQLTLYAAKNGGGFTAVTTGRTDGIFIHDSAYLTQGGDTTERLAGSETFLADNNWQVDNAAATGTLTWPDGATSEAECVWPVTFDQSNLADTDYFEFEVRDGGGVALDAYTRRPTYTIILSGTVHEDAAVDSLTLQDTAAVVATFDTAAVDALVLQDTAAPRQVHAVSVADSFVLQDTPTTRADFKAAVVESLDLGDGIGGAIGFLGPEDSFVLQDFCSSEISVGPVTWGVDADEDLVLQDSAAARIDFAAALTELVTFQDTVGAAWKTGGSATENLLLQDVAAAAVLFVTACVENLVFQDVVSSRIDFKGAAVDSFTIQDSVTGGLLLTVAVVDSFTVQDSVTAEIKNIGYCVEDLVLQDSVTLRADYAGGLVETVVFSDGCEARIVHRPQVADGLTLGDTAAPANLIPVACADGVAFQDTCGSVMLFGASCDELVTFGDLAGSGIVLPVAVVDSLVLQDAITVEVVTVGIAVGHEGRSNLAPDHEGETDLLMGHEGRSNMEDD